MESKSPKESPQEQLDSLTSTASLSAGSSSGFGNEADSARSYTVTTENYPGSIEESISAFSSSSKSSEGKDYDAQTAVETATEKQRKTVGVFQVEPLFGNDRLELTVTHLPMSTSGVIRMPGKEEVANCYWNIYEKNGRCSVHTGAAQGVNEEFNVAANKYKKTNEHDYVEDQLLSHLAAALLGHMVQHEYNHNPSFSIKPENLKPLGLKGYQPPPLLQLSNYMTDLRIVEYEDAAQVAPRRKYIDSLLKNIKTAHGKHQFDLLRFLRLKKDTTLEEQAQSQQNLRDFQDKLTARLITIAQQKGLASQDGAAIIEEAASFAVTSILKPGRLLFNRQGLNAFRVFAAWSDGAELRASAAECIIQLTASLEDEQEQVRREAIQLQIAKIKSTSNELLGSEIRYRISQFLSNLLIVPSLLSLVVNRRVGAFSNIPLHKEALKLNLVSLIEGADVGGCQSAKDRFGSLMCFTRAQEDYIAKYGNAPPFYGLLGFIPGALNVLISVASRTLSFGVDIGLSAVINTLGLFYTQSGQRHRVDRGTVTAYSLVDNISVLFQRGVVFLHDYQQARRVQQATAVEPLGLLSGYGSDRQDFFKERVAEHWVSGAMQYVADANAAGALGIKNNSQIIPASYREAINQKIEEKIQQHYEKIVRLIQESPKKADLLLQNSYDLQQIQYLMKCFPVISEQLANINEAVKKDASKATKANAKIQRKCSAYLKPVLKDIFKISAQSRFESLSSHDQALRSQLQAHILALATISYPALAPVQSDFADLSVMLRSDAEKDQNTPEKQTAVVAPEITVGAVLPPKTVISDPPPGIFAGIKVAPDPDKGVASKNQGSGL